jgi:hypothetical protein
MRSGVLKIRIDGLIKACNFGTLRANEQKQTLPKAIKNQPVLNEVK